MLKKPVIEILNYPHLVEIARNLPNTGSLKATTDRLVYLDISDDFIYTLFPFIKLANVHAPNYFGLGKIGAHISVIYPEERKSIKHTDLGSLHTFKIEQFVKILIKQKYFYVLTIGSSTLSALRHRYHLSDQLAFRGYAVKLHITIGHELIQST